MSKISPNFLLLPAFLLWGQLLRAQPASDNCAEAIAISSVQDYAFSTLGATTDGPYHPLDCTGGAGDSLYYDIWYLFTADFTGTAEFTTCNSADFDTNIAVYAPGSACPPQAGDLIACNEDGSGCSGYTSKLTFDVVSGQSYLLRIGGWGPQGGPGESGSGAFSVGEYEAPVGPPNDECDNAILLDLGQEDSVLVSFSTIDATTSEPYHQTGPAGCLDANEPVPYNDIWYVWTATFTGYVEYSNCGTASFDSKIAVYGPNPTCPPTTESLIVCGDDGCPGFTSVVLFPVEKDSSYLFRLGGWSLGDAGIGTITVKRVPPPVPPANDFCVAYDSVWVTPIELADEFDPVFTGFTSNGSPTPGLEAPSCVAGNEYTDVWYKFNSGNNTQLTLRLNKITDGSQFAVELFDNCGVMTDSIAGPGFCFYTYNEIGDFVSTELTGFPGVPTEYLLRISTDLTYDKSGEFFFQLLGDAFVNTGEPVWEDFSFWPNPAVDMLHVQLRLPAAESLSAAVLNSLGQVVLPLERNRLSAGMQQLKVPLGGLPQGMYFLRLQGSQGQKTVRFVKSPH